MNLIVDTSSWINLANQSFEKGYLKILDNLVRIGKIKLIVPEIIIDEWNKHKDSKVKSCRIDSINSKIKNARSISKFLDSEKMFRFDNLINEISRLQPRIEQEAIRQIEIIDQLFNSSNAIKLSIGNNIKLVACGWAMEKLPPFGQKNSMNDALIFLSTIEYLKEQKDEINYFISDNFTDFATRFEKDSFSTPLKELADKVGLKFFLNVPLFLQEIGEIEIPELDKEVVDLSLNEKLIRRLKSTEICHICGTQITFSWLRSHYFPGLTRHILCGRCGYDIDTLEFWD